MNYSLIRSRDISNGPGVRVSLFTQGCLRHCKGCFNPETWDPSKGKVFTIKQDIAICDMCKDEHVSGLSILGGEPLLPQNLQTLKTLINNFRTNCPNKTIWLWTGYTIETLSKAQYEVFSMCDVVIDGEFVEKLKDTSLYYAGSTNQRMWKRLENGFFVQEKIPSNKNES